MQRTQAFSCRSSGCCCLPSSEARSDETTERFPSGRSLPSRCHESHSCNAESTDMFRTGSTEADRLITERNTKIFQIYFSTSFDFRLTIKLCFIIHLWWWWQQWHYFDTFIGKISRQRIHETGLNPTCPLPHSSLLGWFQAESRRGSSLPTSYVLSWPRPNPPTPEPTQKWKWQGHAAQYNNISVNPFCHIWSHLNCQIYNFEYLSYIFSNWGVVCSVPKCTNKYSITPKEWQDKNCKNHYVSTWASLLQSFHL